MSSALYGITNDDTLRLLSLKLMPQEIIWAMFHQGLVLTLASHQTERQNARVVCAVLLSGYGTS